MRVLVVHNFYGSEAPSGENRVVEAEMSLLERYGHQVALFSRNSDSLRRSGLRGAIRAGATVPWNPSIASEIRRAIRAFDPDVVHAHNTFPLISPAVFYAIDEPVARVLTLHNYRLVCPAAIPMRDGRVCTECIDRRTVIPAVVHGCYRGSRIATLPVAASVALHRAIGTWSKQVEAFVALTEFQRARLSAAGLPAERIEVKPNFFEGNPAVVTWSDRQDVAVFAGRLSPEKGVETLVDAWTRWGAAAPELRILGDGPLRAALEARAASTPQARIRFLGQRSASEAAGEISRARLLLVPSVCFEGFPMVLREAFAFGTPAAVSDLGGLPSIVRPGVCGLSFPPGDARALLEVVREAWTSGRLERMGVGARMEYEARYHERVNLDVLLGVYERAIARRRRMATIPAGIGS